MLLCVSAGASIVIFGWYRHLKAINMISMPLLVETILRVIAEILWRFTNIGALLSARIAEKHHLSSETKYASNLLECFINPMYFGEIYGQHTPSRRKSMSKINKHNAKEVLLKQAMMISPAFNPYSKQLQLLVEALNEMLKR